MIRTAIRNRHWNPSRKRGTTSVTGLLAYSSSLCTLLFASLAAAQPADPLPPDPEFPDGISPSHVYAKLELLDRSLKVLVDARNVSVPSSPQEIETGLQPMHVYQSVLTCTWRLQELDDQVGVKHLPNISAQPRSYAPRDVQFIVNLMLENVRQIGVHEKLDLPTDERPETKKTANDVFSLAVNVFVKLNALCDYDDLSPNEVFAQMVRAEEDVKSILRQIDSACRYRINAQRVPEGATPADAFLACLEIRRQINALRRGLGMPEQPVPDPPSTTIKPRDVFLQTQIIIAELNLLKLRLKTVSSTPLTIPVSGKTPTDVHQKAMFVKYLLEQIKH